MTDDTERMVAQLILSADWIDGKIPIGASRPLTPKELREAAALLTKEREARETLESARQVQDAAIMNLRADFRECATRAESAEAEAKRLREALAELERATDDLIFAVMGNNRTEAEIAIRRVQSARAALAKREGGGG